MRIAATLALLIATLPPAGPAAAQAQPAWPARTIDYVVPYPPGGTTDIIGRTIAQHPGAALKTTVVADNKPGATGTVGGAFVARAPADGNTLLGTSIGPQAIVPHLMRLGYDPAAADEPVSLVGTADTPKAVIGRLDEEIRKTLKDPQVVETFGQLGVAIGGGPEQLAARQKQESARWAQVVKTAGVKLD